MHTFDHTKIYGNTDIPVTTGSFSVTKDGIHFEIVAVDNTYTFKIFDLLSTKLIHEGVIENEAIKSSC